MPRTDLSREEPYRYSDSDEEWIECRFCYFLHSPAENHLCKGDLKAAFHHPGCPFKRDYLAARSSLSSVKM